MADQKQYVRLSSAAKALDCDTETLAKRLRKGELPGFKLGKDWRVNPEEIALSLSQKKKAG